MSDVNDPARAIWETTLRIAEAFDRRDLGVLLDLHYQGPESSMVAHGGDRVVGWDAVRDEIEMRMNEFEYSRTEVSDPVVTIFGSVAVITYGLHSDSRLHDIDFKASTWVTDLLVQRDGRWLRVQHHASDRARR